MAGDRLHGHNPEIEHLLNITDPMRVASARNALLEIFKRDLNKHPDTFQYLLQEEYLTQEALSRLGVDPTTKSSEVPGVDVFHKPVTPDPEFRNKNLIIEVGGDPLAGKTTLIVGGIRYSKPPYFPFMEIVKYAKGVTPPEDTWLSRSIGLHNNKSYFSIHPSKRNIDSSCDFELAKSKLNFGLFNIMENFYTKDMVPTPIVADRWYMDQKIFARGRFLQGKLSFPGYLPLCNPEFKVDELVEKFIPNFSYASIMCLTNPDESMRRAREFGDTINLNSLTKQHEQYLRAHQEILSLGQRRFPYVCIDVSSNNLIENQKKFDGAIQSIYSLYF